MIDIALGKVLKGKKGAFFDMDGVLYDSMGAHADAWSDAFRHFGFDFPPERVYQNEGRTAQSTINLVFQQNEDRKATDSEVEMIYSKKTELIAEYPDAIPFDGAIALMERLKNLGMDIWVVTGSSQEKFLEPLLRDFSRYISADKLITGRDVKHGKPNPEPYLKALSKSGWKPSEVIVIENAPLGIESAKAAGIFTVAVNTGILNDQVLWDAGADVVIKDLNQFISNI